MRRSARRGPRPPHFPVPPFEQIRSRVAELIVSGSLTGGQRLPAVRQLAGDLHVAPGTVARAYKELETAGLLIARRGAGTRVAPGRPPSARTDGGARGPGPERRMST